MRLPLCLCLFSLLISGCSTGLGDATTSNTGATSQAASGNLGLGFDPGLALTDAVGQVAIDGGLLRMEAGQEPVPVVFFAFTTLAAAHDGDGLGNALDREGAMDTNGALDVYLAAISASAIDEAAFTQGLASVFRHARCVTCHSMNASDSDAFQSLLIRNLEGHQGGNTPLNDLSSSACVACHSNVSDWRAPGPAFDLRGKTTLELFNMAMSPPTGMTPSEHFLQDPRVNWALSDGLLPFDNVADDDHDGNPEAEDTDRVVRTVPGGRAAWETKINAWTAAGFPYSSASSAVTDIALVSRIPGGLRISGSAASRNPSIKFVPNDANAPVVAGPEVLGWVQVVFETDADDLISNDDNGASDIYRMTVAVRANEDALGNASPGSINLELDTTSSMRVSVRDGDAAQSDGASSNPVVAGAFGQFVAFESKAGNLLLAPAFQDNNGADPDIFVRDVDSGTTTLISQSMLGKNQGGSGGGSYAPSIDVRGQAVAYESRATDLVPADTNNAQDIFVGFTIPGGPPATRLISIPTSFSNGAPVTGGDCRSPSIALEEGFGRLRVAYESDKINLVPQLPRNSTTNVYLYTRSPLLLTSTTTLLNQRINGSGTILGSNRGGAGVADSRAPSFSPDGKRVMFQTMADNLDVVRSEDLNDASDVVVVELSQFDSQGFILPVRVSVTTDGGSGDGDSTEPLLGSFASASEQFAFGFSVFASDSLNLGNSDNGRHVISFLNESAGAFASFLSDLTSGPAPLTVHFDDRSSGMPSSFLWDFGDPSSADNSSTLESPTHVYQNPGSYDVKLTIQTSTGPAELTRPALIRAFGPPVVDFSGTPLTGSVPFDVQFTDASSEDPSSWSWDFGDGSSSTLQNPLHTYTTAGSYSVVLSATGVGGSGTKTELGYVSAFDAVAAEFSATPMSGIAPLDVNFSDLTSGDPTAWAWDFGDSNDSTLQNPSHRFEDPGTFNVTLSATGPGGMSSVSKTITVFEPVFAALSTLNSPTGVAPYTVNFRNDTSGDEDAWAWNFGDVDPGANTSSLENPSHTYNTPGQYSVTLSASGPGGTDSVTVPDLVLIHAPVVAEYGFLADAGTPRNVQFSDLSLGAPSSWLWDFGDPASGSANTSSAQSPLHSFSSPGFYNVSLRATGPGGSDIETKTIGVDLGGAMADFTLAAGSTPTGFGRMVGFVDTSNFTATSWAWSFGDGGVSSEQNPTHLYNAPGVFQVTLAASGAGGVSDTEIKPGFITVFEPTVARFASSSTSGDADLAVNFTNQTTGDADTWAWDFGDPSSPDNTATTRDASHTFRSAGPHLVTLTSSGDGGTDSASAMINVAMATDFTPTPLTPGTPARRGFPGMQVQFTDTSMGSPDTWAWNFGEAPGASDPTAQNPTHTYLSSTGSPFDVSLSASLGGVSDTETKLGVIEIGTASFSASTLIGYRTLTSFAFSDTTAIPSATRSWNFGDNSPTSSSPNPSHSYQNAGTYTVTLTLTDGSGGSSTASMDVTVSGTYMDVYSNIMGADCVRCHFDGDTTNALSFGPDRTTMADPNTVYLRLDMPSTSTSLGCANTRRVDRGNPGNSLLYTSTLSTFCTSRQMTGANSNLIRDWILAGAGNN